MADIADGDPLAVVRIPFWSWAAEQQAVLDILHSYRATDELKFSGPLVSDVLPLCAATITGQVIELRAPCPPIAKIPSFVTAKRRVYLTARPEARLQPITSTSLPRTCPCSLTRCASEISSSG